MSQICVNIAAGSPFVLQLIPNVSEGEISSNDLNLEAETEYFSVDVAAKYQCGRTKVVEDVAYQKERSSVCVISANVSFIE